ncbi:MAG TPA: hypothetical protein DCP97_00900 [Ruminococcaceae bacterium]|nr:hypothetical protein [Oscillospiraceae bacterium]
MRITNSMMSRNYLRGLNNNLSTLNTLRSRSETGRKFTRAYQDPVAASRALSIRDSINKMEVWKENASIATDVLHSAETAAMGIKEIVDDAYVELLKANNDPNGIDERRVLSQSIESKMQEILGLANTQFADRYVMAGSNNSTKPFTLDASGYLVYNGKAVADGGPFPNDSDVFVDVGLGLSLYTPAGEPYPTQVDPLSAMQISVSGVDVLGEGSDNIFNILKDAADLLKTEPFDHSALETTLSKLDNSRKSLLIQVTELGDRQKFAEYNNERLDSDLASLVEASQETEYVDLPTAIMDFKMQEFVYNASLKMGGKVLQYSLFDFLA